MSPADARLCEAGQSERQSASTQKIGIDKHKAHPLLLNGVGLQPELVARNIQFGDMSLNVGQGIGGLLDANFGFAFLLSRRWTRE